MNPLFRKADDRREWSRVALGQRRAQRRDICPCGQGSGQQTGEIYLVHIAGGDGRTDGRHPAFVRGFVKRRPPRVRCDPNPGSSPPRTGRLNPIKAGADRCPRERENYRPTPRTVQCAEIAGDVAKTSQQPVTHYRQGWSGAVSDHRRSVGPAA